MPLHSAVVWLSDIRSEIRGIRTIVDNVDGQTFAESWASKRAVEHALLIIAEAAKHLPEDMKGKHADVPWTRIHGLGNLLRHEYRRIDPDILWSIIQDHLEPLDQAAGAMLIELGA